jgi:acetyl esterase/lipase
MSPMITSGTKPLFYAKDVKTPTMIITGEEDWRTPIAQSQEFFRALKVRGIDAMLVRVPGESHGIQNGPSHKTRADDLHAGVAQPLHSVKKLFGCEPLTFAEHGYKTRAWDKRAHSRILSVASVAFSVSHSQLTSHTAESISV